MSLLGTKRKRICIITPDYLAATPRVVKEADALSAAGYDVRVVFSEGNLAYVREFDEIFLQEKPWQRAIVRWAPFEKEERLLYYYSKMRVHMSDVFSFLWDIPGVAERAEGRLFTELLRLAKAQKADLYIGHYPAGLSIAAYAAGHWRVPYAYDIEDFHSGELSDTPVARKRSRRIVLLENRFIRACGYVTASSQGIAEHVAKKYGVRKPIVVKNVFPLAERSKVDGLTKDRKSDALSLYWYSQVIGEDRGIQDVIRAAGLLPGAIQVHLRGYVSDRIKERLVSLSEEAGISRQLYFHDPVPPTELLSRTMEHDIGLACEQTHTLNRQIAVTNKLFFYMLAGLGVAATNTTGQADIMNSSPGVGFMYSSGDYRALADGLQNFIADPAQLVLCKKASLKAAQMLWNWEAESKILLDVVSRAIGDPFYQGE